jgi:hypothetical protein
MSSNSLFASVAVLAMLALSCKGINAAYCAQHPDDRDCRSDSGVDSMVCMNDAQCADMYPVCDSRTSLCVQCTAAEAGACRGTSPVCGADDACRACLADAECGSLACLPDGSCATADTVLYAAPDGDVIAHCMPSAICTLARAVELADTARSTIRLAPGRYDLIDSLTLGKALRIVGRGAVIARDAGGVGPTLTIAADVDVELDYVTVEGGDGESLGAGIECGEATLTGRELTVQGNAAAGIHSVGCNVTLDRARLAANQGPGIAVSGGTAVIARSLIVGNQVGGLVLESALFDLHNNFIVRNGNPTSLFGGMLISQVGARGLHALEFNTIAHNQATMGSTAGVICSVITTPLSFGNDIVFDNAAGTQVEGANCAWTYSDIGPVPVAGIGNFVSDPVFTAPAQNNFHLQVASPLRDAADPAATLADDIDGEARPQGSGRDVGADEIK